MITVSRYRNSLIFSDKDGKYIHGIVFYPQRINGIQRRCFYKIEQGRPTFEFVENILEVIPDPYKTVLLFNMELIEEVCQSDEYNKWKY